MRLCRTKTPGTLSRQVLARVCGWPQLPDMMFSGSPAKCSREGLWVGRRRIVRRLARPTARSGAPSPGPFPGNAVHQVDKKITNGARLTMNFHVAYQFCRLTPLDLRWMLTLRPRGSETLSRGSLFLCIRPPTVWEPLGRAAFTRPHLSQLSQPLHIHDVRCSAVQGKGIRPPNSDPRLRARFQRGPLGCFPPQLRSRGLTRHPHSGNCPRGSG